MTKLTKDVLLPVQYLRALAALAVFQFHLSATVNGHTPSGNVPVEKIGAAGVDLFFVISGFIMASVVWNRPITFSGFMLNRIVRIVPLYWAATFVVFGIALFAPTLLGSTTADPMQLLHSLFFIPNGMNASSPVPTLIVGWTLNYEVFFYCLIAIFASLINDRKLILTSLVMCCLVAAGFMFQPENEYAQFYLNPIILEFPLGILVFHCWRLTKETEINFFYGLLFWIGFVLIAAHSINSQHGFRVLQWGVPSALLLYGALRWVTLESEPLKLLGDWSYSIYLLHLFLIMGFHKIIIPVFMPSQAYMPVFGVLITASLISISALSYYWFERPVTRWLNTRIASNATVVSQN